MSDLKLLNKEQIDSWMAPLMQKGYGFNYTKGYVEGATYSDGTTVGDGMNVAITCIETGETKRLLWG